jgi:hypothetical protein
MTVTIKNRERVILLVVLVVGLWVAFMVGRIFVMPLFQYLILDKREVMKGIAVLELPASAKEQKRVYASGICFDNCPGITVNYNLDMQSGKALDELEKTFKENGYDRIDRSNNGFIATASKDNGHYFATASVLHADMTYKGIDDGTRISKLVIRMTFNHNNPKTK